MHLLGRLTVIQLVALAVARQSAASVERTRSMLVRTNPPWYLQFTFDTDASFQPQTLTATFKNEEVPFESSSDMNSISFQNTHPLSFVKYDVISAELAYTKNGEARSTKFDYTIKAEPRRTVLIKLIEPIDTIAVGGMLDAGEQPTADTIDSFNDADNMSLEALLNTTWEDYGGDVKCASRKSSYHEQLLNTALQHGNFGKRLILTGLRLPLTNAVDEIREVIENRLKLPHLGYRILQAQFKQQSLLFEMQESKDAIEILTQASLRLQAPAKIELTDRDFRDGDEYSDKDLVDISSLQRSTN